MRISILTIRGLVQGVGFRPFIYRIANEMKIKGEVGNRNNGVSIRAILTPEQRELFISRIRNEHPAVASIHSVQWEEADVADTDYPDFMITPSRSDSEEVTQVAPISLFVPNAFPTG